VFSMFEPRFLRQVAERSLTQQGQPRVAGLA
jgi:hypothetical protein